jgi:predicted phosphodiesterase
LGRKLYNENPELFPSQDAAYQAVRHKRGVHGKKNSVIAKFKKDSKGVGFIYTMPASQETDWLPFELSTSRNLILSDVHIPYHNEAALSAAVEHGKKLKPDCVILNGDTADFYSISRFLTDPKKRNLKNEVENVRHFLGWLRGQFPKARIIYKLGNHDERWANFIWIKAAELWDFEELQIEQVLDFENFGIEIVKDQKIIQIGKLSVLHGHEFPKGLTNAVNPARGNFLRGLESSLAGHLHRTSEHTETSMAGKIISCWSTGCLCGLNPGYSRINKTNHGFAFVELFGEGQFNVNNFRILNGRVL